MWKRGSSESESRPKEVCRLRLEKVSSSSLSKELKSKLVQVRKKQANVVIIRALKFTKKLQKNSANVS